MRPMAACSSPPGSKIVLRREVILPYDTDAESHLWMASQLEATCECQRDGMVRGPYAAARRKAKLC